MKRFFLTAAFTVGLFASTATSQECVNGSCNIRSMPQKVMQVASQPVRQVASVQPVRKVLRFRPLRRLFGR